MPLAYLNDIAPKGDFLLSVLAVDVFANACDLSVLLVAYEKCRCLTETDLACEVLVFLNKELIVCDSCLVKHRSRYLALGAGLCCEEDGLCALCRSLCCYSRLVCGAALSLENACLRLVNYAVLELLALTVVPVLNGTVVACDSGINLGLVAALGALVNLAGDISVVLTY